MFQRNKTVKICLIRNKEFLDELTYDHGSIQILNKGNVPY